MAERAEGGGKQVEMKGQEEKVLSSWTKDIGKGRRGPPSAFL